MQKDLSEYLNPLPSRPDVIETLTNNILNLIEQGGMKPGDRIPSEQEIMEVTSASRPSVREALRALKTLGIVESRPGAGSFVGKRDPQRFIRRELISFALMGESFRDILEARKVLECELARLAAQRDLRELARVEEALRDMKLPNQDLYESTWAFHMELAEAAGNPVMAKLVRILYEMIREIQLKVYWPHIDEQEEIESHEELYEALLAGPEEAELAMREHLDDVLETMEQATLRDLRP
jgi:GntR family transcriptional repressor for pyruvate dehydrogenase complex